MPRQNLPNYTDRSCVDGIRRTAIGRAPDGMPKYSGFSKLAHQVPARLVDLRLVRCTKMIVRPDLHFPRQTLVAGLEERPIQMIAARHAQSPSNTGFFLATNA